MRSLGSAGSARRSGASLVELLVALVLFGLVGAETLRALDHQARFHAGIAAILEARAQHAAAHEALAVELRAMAPGEGDIARLADSAVAFRLQVGQGVSCGANAGYLDLAPDSVASGQRLARMRTSPQPGDTAWLLDEGATDATIDDRWAPLEVQGVSRSVGRCTSSPLVDPIADAARPGWRFSIAGPGLPPTAAVGAPVRLTRPARFALYRGGTGEHWLGFAERAPGSGWVTIQPVSGPYLPYRASRPAASGVAFAARDSSGALAGAGNAAAVEVATRTLTGTLVRIDGLPGGRAPDSLHSLVGLRNR